MSGAIVARRIGARRGDGEEGFGAVGKVCHRGYPCWSQEVPDIARRMNVSHPDAMKAWVESRSADGRYANASDYVRDPWISAATQEREAAMAPRSWRRSRRGSTAGVAGGVRLRGVPRPDERRAWPNCTRLSRAAERDLEAIWILRRERLGGATRRIAYARRLREVFGLLASMPGMGALLPRPAGVLRCH